jgi:hypothetical protein
MLTTPMLVLVAVTVTVTWICSLLLVNVIDKIALSSLPSDEQFRNILEAVEATVGTPSSTRTRRFAGPHLCCELICRVGVKFSIISSALVQVLMDCGACCLVGARHMVAFQGMPVLGRRRFLIMIRVR